MNPMLKLNLKSVMSILFRLLLSESIIIIYVFIKMLYNIIRMHKAHKDEEATSKVKKKKPRHL